MEIGENSGNGFLAPPLMGPLDAQLVVYQETSTTTSMNASAEASISQVQCIPLVENSEPLPSLSEHTLSTSIAQPYDYLPDTNSTSPIPEQTTSQMPPFLCAHTRKQITYPLNKFAGGMLRHRGEMRQRRAWERAHIMLKKA